MIVLVAEDEAIVALQLAEVLQDAGHHVLGPAATRSEALTLAGQARPDVAIVDVRLRLESGNALELAGALRAQWAVPVLLTSGLPLEALPQGARQTAIGFIAKPWLAETMVAAIDIVARLGRGLGAGPVPAGLTLFAGIGDAGPRSREQVRPGDPARPR